MLNEKTVLIVEDELKILEVVKAYMERDGWSPVIACDGNEALRKYLEKPPDLIILDLMLGTVSGEEIIKKIRMRSNVPIIVMTSKSRESDRINGLNYGADDYVVKPFSPNELVARAHAVHRRSVVYAQNSATKKVSFDEGKLEIDTQLMKIFVNGIDINLTNTEYKLLSSMSISPEKIFTRADLLYFALGYRYVGDPRSIDAHIKNIRQKIEADPKYPRILQTVIGIGYKFGVKKDE